MTRLCCRTAAALLLAAAACAGPRAITLEPLQPSQSAKQLIDAQLRPTPTTGCLLAWGDLPALREARAVRLQAGGATLDTVAVCGLDSQRQLLADPRLKGGAALYFRAGRFVAGHPSNPSAKDALPPPGGAPAGLGLFADPNPEGSAEELLRALGELQRRFLVVGWDLVA